MSINDIYISDAVLKRYSFLRKELAEKSYIELVRFSSITDPAGWLKEVANTSGQTSFCLLYDIPTADVAMLQWVVRMTFSTRYRKDHGVLKIFTATGFVDVLKKKIEEQGYDFVEILDLTQLQTFHFHKVHGYTHSCDNTAKTDLIITTIDSSSNETNTAELFHSFHFLLSETSDLAGYLKIAEAEKKLLSNEIKQLKAELKNHQQYLEIALRQKETETILHFYHSEYEVLPLWYKRFGHLIKIITGHRKLKVNK